MLDRRTLICKLETNHLLQLTAVVDNSNEQWPLQWFVLLQTVIFFERKEKLKYYIQNTYNYKKMQQVLSALMELCEKL